MAKPRRDSYHVLGVPPDADLAAIHSAYRRLARRYHPDVARDAASKRKFLEIQEAYAVLSDELKRRNDERTRPRSTAASRPANSSRSVQRYVVLDVLGLRVDAGISVGALFSDDDGELTWDEGHPNT